ncbi:MAG: hypothetical protein JWR19_2803 [Pedosphaera sp.]|nr:hypothetical protein [Pedosphaera sp.]
MGAYSTAMDVRQISALLRGEPQLISGWIQQWSAARTALYVAVIVAGTGLYGAAMGCWREPLQGLFTAIKFPLIILLTTLGNGLLNGMLAPLLGLNLSFRQSLQAILMSFTIAAAILASFSPLVFFLIWNAPPMASRSANTYDFILLTHVAVIAFAGIAANLRLAQLLRRLSGSTAVGRRVLIAWLAGNLFLGSQLSWILRPFIGSPGLPVEFLRKDALAGNFFESVFQTLKHLLSF